MCNAQAVGMVAQTAGTAMSARNAAQNQIGQYRAQQQAQQQTNERQRLLRSLERGRQDGMNTQQIGQFQRALDDADPSRMREREQQMQTEREDLSRRVRAQTSADSPLPGTSIPGGGSGLMENANRVVENNLTNDAESLGARSADLQAFPEAMNRLGYLFQGPQTNIARLAQDSQMSRGLLPNEMDAARIAPRVPAPRADIWGQLLSGLGGGLQHYAGINAGDRQRVIGEHQGQIPGTPFSRFPLGTFGGS